MAEDEELRLSELVPVTKELFNVMFVPGIPKGRIARALRESYKKYVQNVFGGNSILLDAMKYDEVLDTLTYSHFFGANILWQAIRQECQAFDVACYTDLVNPEVVESIKGIFADAGDAVVLRGTNKFYSQRDKVIFEQLMEYIDNLKTPILVRGVKVVPGEKDKGHGLNVIKGEDFRFVHSNVLSKNGRFNITDNDDLPILDDYGNYNLFVSDRAISGLCREGSSLFASRSLAIPYRDGQVVLVSRRVDLQDLESVIAA